MVEKIDKLFISAEYRVANNKDYEKENTDVIVLLENGNKYAASFFTYENIQEQKNTNKENGRFLNGKYFWENGMLVIESCAEQTITEVIHDLLEEGDFFEVFKKL